MFLCRRHCRHRSFHDRRLSASANDAAPLFQLLQTAAKRLRLRILSIPVQKSLDLQHTGCMPVLQRIQVNVCESTGACACVHLDACTHCPPQSHASLPCHPEAQAANRDWARRVTTRYCACYRSAVAVARCVIGTVSWFRSCGGHSNRRLLHIREQHAMGRLLGC